MSFIKKHLGLLLFVLAVATSVACSRSNDDDDGSVISGGGEYSIRVTASTGVTINSVAIFIDGSTNSFTPNVSGTWTSDTYKGSNFAASVGAIGLNNSSTLKLELLKEGNVVKTSTASGQYLTATISN